MDIRSEQSDDWLHTTLRPIFRCLTVFGYYRPKCNNWIFARIYDCYSLFCVFWCIFGLTQFSLKLPHVKGTDITSVLIISGIFWHIQATFCAIFSIVVFKSGKIDEIFKLWKTADLDKLILRTKLLKIWRYLVVAFALGFIFLASLPLEIGYFVKNAKATAGTEFGRQMLFGNGIVVEFVQATFTRTGLCLPAMAYSLLGLTFATTVHGLKKSIENNEENLCQIMCALTEQHFQISIIISKTDRLFRFFVAVILCTGVPISILLLYSAIANYDAAADGVQYLEIQVIALAVSQLAQIFLILMSTALINHYGTQLYDAMYDQYIKYAKKTTETIAQSLVSKGKGHVLGRMDTQTSLLMLSMEGEPLGRDEMLGRLMVIQQINILLNRLANANLGFTVWRLFVVTRGSIVTTVSLVASYFFLLLQFMIPPCGDCSCGNSGNSTTADFLKIDF